MEKAVSHIYAYIYPGSYIHASKHIHVGVRVSLTVRGDRLTQAI